MGNRYVIDINIASIYLVENHPGYAYVSSLIDKTIYSGIRLIIFDFLPFRVFWIMTSKWDIPKYKAMESVLSLLELPNIHLVSLNKEDILKAFDLSKNLKHDVYDATYIVLAEKTKANGIITTDTDFEKLCNKVGLEYINPVPRHILKKFERYR